MRAEIKGGTEFGKKIKQYSSKGELVPFELTVQILVNGLKANPAKVSF